MKRFLLFSIYIFIIVSCISAFGAGKVKLYRTNNGEMYFRSTEIIYKDYIEMDGGKTKHASPGNTFAQIMVNFANLTDKSTQVSITVDPKNILLLGDKKPGEKRKIFSGVQATSLMKKDLKPFTKEIVLKPGEDIVAAYCFHIPKGIKIAGVMYKLDKTDPLIIDYSSDPQP